MFTAIDQ
jgi:hypothetical protein